MRKKYIAIFLAMLVLPLIGMHAQENAFSILSFDIGYGMAYWMNPDATPTTAITGATNFGVNVRVANPLIIGVGYENFGAGNSSMLNIKYDIIRMIRAMLSFGVGNVHTFGTNELLTGLGFEVVPFRRQVSSLFTEFKMITQYTFAPRIIEEGHLKFGLALSVGF